MELKMSREEVGKVILLWIEKELPGKFNSLRFLYNNEVELTFVEPKPEKPKEAEIES